MTTGENKDTAETQPNAEPEIIDVEVIKEEVEPSSSSANTPNKAKQTSSKSGWISAAVLAAFIGGLYAAPYFKEGLTAVGLLPASPPPIVTGASIDLEPLETSINDLKAQLLRHREILAQLQTASPPLRQLSQIFKLVRWMPPPEEGFFSH